MAATYASGTVRARRWHGDGDVRGYRPPRGWTARADLTDLHPHGPRLAARRVVDHRNQGITSRTGPGRAALGPVVENRARRWPRPVSLLKAERPIAAFGQAAMGPRTRALVREIHEASSVAHRAANDSTEPRRNGRGWCGYAPACCGRLHESVPSSTLAVRCLYVTKDGSPTRRPASLLWSFHATPQYGPQAAAGALWPCRRGIDLARVRAQPVKPSRGDAESAMSPFGSGRPRRPCLVVNPGGGAAAPGLHGRNLPAKTISPALRAFLADKFFSLPGSPRCCDRKRCASPSPPAGSQQGRTGATLFNPKGEIIMANIGTFTAEKDGFTGTLRTLTLNVKVKLVPNDKGDNENAPDFRLQAAGHDIGAAWKKTSEAGREYLSVPSTILRSRRRSMPA
jgi:hypothetical protein